MPEAIKLQSSMTRKEYVHSALTVLLRDFGYRISNETELWEMPFRNFPARFFRHVRDVLDAAEQLIPLLVDDEYYRRYVKITTDDGTIQYKGE